MQIPTKEELKNNLLYKRDAYIDKYYDTRNKMIAEDYKNFVMTVEKLAIKYEMTVRSIQRICKKEGVIRTIAEANKIAAPFKNYEGHRVPDHLKVKRTSLPRGVRARMLKETPRCKLCGNTAMECPLQIDHIDNNPTNHELSNLQVLCMICNRDKKQESLSVQFKLNNC